MIPINQYTSIDIFDAKLILEILEQEIYEDLFLEFKESFEARNSDVATKNDYKYKVRRSIASLSNSLGGFIIFGIRDEKKYRKLDRLHNVETQVTNSEIVQAIHQIYLGEGLSEPRVSIVGSKSVIVKDHKILIFKIQANQTTPIGIKASYSGPFEFWQREGSHAKAMSYAEIQNAMDRTDRKSLCVQIDIELRQLELAIKNNVRAIGEEKHRLIPFTLPTWIYQMPNVIKYFSENKALLDKLFHIKYLIEVTNYYISNLEDTFSLWIITNTETDRIGSTKPQSIQKSQENTSLALNLLEETCSEALKTLYSIYNITA